MRRLLLLFALTATILALAWIGRVLIPQREPSSDRSLASRTRAADLGLPPDTSIKLESWRKVEDLDQELAQFATVFWEPADTESLRRLIRETPVVANKTVLEIGTGTGLISFCCLEAGASRVVATDVNPCAIANAAYNAEVLGVTDRFETRFVPLKRCDAYTVISDAEQFNLIISNPPWENQKTASYEQCDLYDEGFRLLRSILKDLDKHLTPGGKALLTYGCVNAITTAIRLADEYHLDVHILDDRELDDLPETFVPGMVLELKARPES